MKKIFRFISNCIYCRLITLKNCEEAKKRGLKFSHNSFEDSVNRSNGSSFWYDEYDLLYKVNEKHDITRLKTHH